MQDFKGHGHDTDEWRDCDVSKFHSNFSWTFLSKGERCNEDNVPFERLEKLYVLDEDSLEQNMNIFHGQLYSLYRDNRQLFLPLQLFFFYRE